MKHTANPSVLLSRTTLSLHARSLAIPRSSSHAHSRLRPQSSTASASMRRGSKYTNESAGGVRPPPNSAGLDDRRPVSAAMASTRVCDMAGRAASRRPESSKEEM
ncbi:hypothetical protein CONPUDRAFT_85312, partial [Coniophora puteana RWD-64-598 SS2]